MTKTAMASERAFLGSACRAMAVVTVCGIPGQPGALAGAGADP